MIKFFLIFVVLIFTACSFSTPPNQWQYNSLNAFESYKKNFLSNKDSIAKEDFGRAVKHAKHSSNLDQLAKIYLGKCAINNSVGIDDRCREYQDLRDLLDNKKLNSYYLFISKKLREKDVKYLPDHYEDFAYMYLKKDYEKAIEEMFEIDIISSKLIAANMLKDSMEVEHIQRLLDEVSFYGYKKTVVYWLEVMRSKTKDTQKIQKIDKKIKILRS